MIGFRSLTTVAAGAVLTASVLAAHTAAGSYHGKLVIHFPKAANAQQQQGIAMTEAMLSKVTLNLTMKPNHTYILVIHGGPQGNKAQTDTGKWTQSGSTVTATSNNMKDPHRTKTATLSPNGKTLVFTMPPQGGATAKLVFTR